MRTGWLRFGRARGGETTTAPDSGVTGLRAWLLRAAIVASTAALLGTTDDEGPDYWTTYTFERNSVDGGFAELTRESPTATFYVTIRADDLGPDGAVTTDDVNVTFNGAVTTSGLDEGKAAPLVSVKLSTPERGSRGEKLVYDDYSEHEQPLFTGNCKTPKSGAACAAHLVLELSRQDNGDSNGVARFDWSLDVSARAELEAKESSQVGPLDPPWTISVSQQ